MQTSTTATENTDAQVGDRARANHPAPRFEDLSKQHDRGCAKSLKYLSFLLRADLYRYSGRVGVTPFLRHFLFTPGYKYTVVMRTCGYFRTKKWTRYTLHYIFKWILLRYRYKYGIAIPEYTVIGPGLFINRYGGIYVNGDVIIGENLNLMHGVRIGQLNRGDRMGSPIIGDSVFLGMGCAVIGRIHLADGSVVGVNAVVSRDVPPNGVVGGIPAKLISNEGSRYYNNRLYTEAVFARVAD